VLSAFGDVSSDGSEVVACLAATAQLTLTLKKTNGVFSNEDSQVGISPQDSSLRSLFQDLGLICI
jgi:hypothetical protein